MYCTQCGYKLDDADRYCAMCGKPARADVPPPPPRMVRRLARPMKEKKIAGVCAGFARYLELDVALVRILWVVLTLFWGMGLVAYIVAWIVMPKDEGTLSPQAC